MQFVHNLCYESMADSVFGQSVVIVRVVWIGDHQIRL